MRLHVFFIFILLSLSSWAQAPHYQKPFGLKIQGLRSQIEALKVKAQLQAARDTRYCRGANIPVPKGEWECEKPGPGVERCEIEYRCARIRANLSRLTETRRLLAKSREVGGVTGEHEIEFYPEPNLPKVADLKFSPGPSRAKNTREVRPSEVVEKKMPDRSAVTQAEKGKSDPDEVKSSSELIEQREQERSRLAREDQQDFESLMQEAPKREETKADQSSNSTLSSMELMWKKVSASYVSSTNEFEESQSQINLAWTPELRLTKSWSLQGQLGGHSYKVLTLEGEESFFVIDTFAHLNFSFWEKWQVSAGIGMQKWNSEESQSLTGLALGASRSIDWGYLDRVYVQRVSLSGDQDASISELRFGVTLSF